MKEGGVSRHSFKNVLSQSTEKISYGNLPIIYKYSGIEKLHA